MKLQLDTVSKTIKVESDIILSDLVDTLEKLLPNGEWKTFILQTHVSITNWSYPIIIEKEVYRRPWYDRPYWLSSTGDNIHYAKADNVSLKAGVFNVEAKTSQI